jgi:hypothetical protein
MESLEGISLDAHLRSEPLENHSTISHQEVSKDVFEAMRTSFGAMQLKYVHLHLQ